MNIPNNACIYTYQSSKKLEKLQKTNPDYNVGLISNVRYFTSKKGNRCCWYNIYVNDDIKLEDMICCNAPPKFLDGSYIFFLVSENPKFPQIIEVI